MKPTLAVLSAVTLLSFLPLPAQSKPPKAAAPDPHYIVALAAADYFLHAWQTRDHETGLLMLTDAAKRHTSEDRLQEFFSPGGATWQAYEIGPGKRLQSGRYSFPVTLLVAGPGKERKPSRRWSQIMVIRTGKDDWAIDKLP